MVELKTIYNNIHNYLRRAKETNDPDFLDYAKECENDVFKKVQPLAFAALSQKKPKGEENMETYEWLVRDYNSVPKYRNLVNKVLDHVAELYKGQILRYKDGTTVQVDKLVELAKSELASGKIDFDRRRQSPERVDEQKL